MKTTPLLKIAVMVILLVTVVSCKDKTTTGLSNLAGSMNEVLVVMDKDLWNGPAGDTVKAWFSQEQLGLPQPEPVMDILNLPLASFDKNVKGYRNVLLVRISPKIDSTAIRFKDSPWAKGQKYFEIQAPNETDFVNVFDANKQSILDVFMKAEQERLISVYKKQPNSAVYNLFKDKYHMYVACPGDYIVNKDIDGFVWISRETRTDGRGIIFFEKEYKDASQFHVQAIVDTVNAELKRNIPGPLANTYMALDTIAPTETKIFNYNGDHYAVMMRGLWTVVNDYMGGPYVMNVILDAKNNRIDYMMGYVYAPDDKKRNRLQRVEAILNTVKLDYQESGK
ncbi:MULTISPECIES: DUF4837 family protein [Culturomica]|uniref:DUF4837 family protein n=1 Tax=Culturomica TaxID=1926651 RepID=UPI000E9E988B|nr:MULTISPECIES: DUF4837 family protein [Culturomica]HBO27029.1 DUF4837 domain-containing protein [Culturomica sp.]